MRKLRLTESQLIKIIKNIISEGVDTPHFINDILEKIGEVGYKGLTEIEQTMIDSFSNDIFDKDNIMFLINKKIAKGGLKSLSEIELGFYEDNAPSIEDGAEYQDYVGVWDYSNADSDLDGMQFKYRTSYDEDDSLVHEGELIVGDYSFFGNVYCDVEGNYDMCSFETDDGELLFDVFKGSEKEIRRFFEQVCDDLKGNFNEML
jgi:hypothetical protein